MYDLPRTPNIGEQTSSESDDSTPLSFIRLTQVQSTWLDGFVVNNPNLQVMSPNTKVDNFTGGSVADTSNLQYDAKTISR